jgi:hypothetical protein
MRWAAAFAVCTRPQTIFAAPTMRSGAEPVTARGAGDGQCSDSFSDVLT